MCFSAYDTKIYVYCGGPSSLVDCNDDFYFSEPCGVYVSKLENVPLFAGLTYYIVIDGYGGDCGEYTMEIYSYSPCVVDCPPEYVPEGEPELYDDYVDNYNGGCNSTPWVFQNLEGWDNDCAYLCGRSALTHRLGTQTGT